MSALGSLVVKLALETAEYTQGLDKNSQDAKKFAANAQRAFDDLGSNIRGFALGAAGSLASAFAVGAVVNFARDTINAAAALNDLSISSGMTVESLSGLAEVGQYSGISADKLANASNKLARNLAGVDEEGKGSAQAIRALGIDFDTFAGLRPEERMQMVATSMAGFADGSDKSAAAMMLFGKEGAAMLPMLKDLATSGDLVARVTTEQARASDELSDNIQKTQVTSAAWKKELVLGMTPALAEASQAYLDVMNSSGGVRDSVRQLSADGSIANWTRSAITGATYVMDGFAGVVRVVRHVGEIIGFIAADAATWITGLGSAITRMLQRDWSGAMAEMDATTARSRAMNLAHKSTLDDLWGAPTLGQQLRDRMADLHNTGAASEAIKPKLNLRSELTANTAAAAEKKDGFDALMRKLNEYTAQTVLANTQGRELTQVQRLEIDMTEALKNGTIRMTEKRSEAWAATLAQAQGAQRNAVELAAEKKWIDDSAKANDERVGALYRSTDALQAQVAKQREENELLGKTPEQLEALAAARNDDAIATALQSAALADQVDWSGQLGAEYRKQANALRELAGLKAEAIHTRAAMEAQKAWEKTTQAMEADWQKKIDAMTSGLTTSVEGWIVDGQSLWGNLAKQVKKTFAEMVLRPLIQPIMGSVAGGIMSMLGGPASAATGGAGAGGGAGGMLSNLLGMGGAMGAFGAGMGAGFGGLMGSIGGLFGAAGTGATLGGALSAGGIALGSGGIMAGLGTLAGALGPLALGVMALASLDRKGGGPKTEGSYSTGGGLMVRGTSGELSPEMQGGAQAMVAQYNALMGTFGRAGGRRSRADAAIFAAMDNGAGGDAQTQLQLALGLDGRVVFNRESLRGGMENVGRGPEALKAAIELESLRAVLTGLKESDITATAAEYLQGIDTINGGLDDLRRGINTLTDATRLGQAIEPLGGVFGRIAGLSISARAGLIDMAGGLDAFLGKTKGFVDAYYSDIERGAIDAQRIVSGLTAAGVAAADLTDRASLRRRLEGTDVTTEQGRLQFAALLDASASFAQLAPLLQSQGLTLNALAAQAPTGFVAQQLAQAQDNAADQAAAQRASLDALAAIARATTDAVQQVGATTNAALAEVVRATRATADYLDDVIRGGSTVNTAAA